jgi:hypothetical protein
VYHIPAPLLETTGTLSSSLDLIAKRSELLGGLPHGDPAADAAAAKNVYHLPEPLLKGLQRPSVLAWTLVAKLSELL